MPEPTYKTRPLREDERDWLSEVLLERWGGELIVGRGRARQLSGDPRWPQAAHSRIDDWAQAMGGRNPPVSCHARRAGAAELVLFRVDQEGSPERVHRDIV